MNRRLTETEIEDLRQKRAQGASAAELAAEFRVSERTVFRQTEGIEQEPPRFTVDPDTSVAVALDRFLQELKLDPRDGLRAAAARALASRLDRASARDAPALARSLVDVLAELRGEAEPDRLDDLNRRREARLLAMRARGA